MKRSLFLGVQALSILSLWLFTLSMVGQVNAAAPITPSGLNTQVSGPIIAGSGPTQTTQYNITGGTRPGGATGTNLFHSFGDFNVPTNNIANFLNTGSVDLSGAQLPPNLPTSNILGRVTGVNPSIIFGTIQTNGTGGFGNANLFLMNPHGFLFGPKATVNVGGMVAFTTADYLTLRELNGSNAGVFHADTAQTGVLTSAPVAAFGFLGSNPAAIAVQGSTLTVAPGQSISLIGGNEGFSYKDPDTGITGSVPGGVTVTGGKLSAPRGQITLASVASPGEMLAGTLTHTPNINGQTFEALGSVEILQQSVVDVSGNGGGTVLIRGGRFVLDNSTISANVTGPGPISNGVESKGSGIDIVVSQEAMIGTGSLLETNVQGNATPGEQYGGVHIKADRIEIVGDPGFDFENGPFTAIHSDVAAGSTGGNSGPIKLEANSILLQDFVTVGTLTSGVGNAGNILLQANDNIELNGALLSANSISAGKAGNIELTSAQGSILMTNAPSIESQAFGSGTVGNIRLTAPAGEILLSNFDVFSGAVFTRNQGTSGVAGNGGIQIIAKDLTIVNSGIQIDNFSPAQPGNLDVTLTGRLSLTGSTDIQSTLLTTTRREARSATLNIMAHDILLTGNSLVSTETFRNGEAGTLNIFTQALELHEGAQIRSSSRFNPSPSPGDPIITPSGAGGTIKVGSTTSPAQSILIDGRGSGIFTNTEGTGAGGDISIHAGTLTLQNGGTISAETSGKAPSATGGTITINANQLQLNPGGLITAASTGAGVGGAISIDAGSTFTSNAGTVSSTASQANGGDIAITAGQLVSLMNGATISASSIGTGNAGNIQINAGQNFTATNSSVTTQAEAASGGTIKITTNPSGSVQLTNSMISASVLDGTGGGGSVNIDPQFVLLQNSQILAQAVQGPGGNIFITTNLLLPDANSLISASSQFGQQGSITIQSPISPASGKIVPLSQKPLIATAITTQRCAALAGGESSSLTVAGRDSLPTEPGGWLASPLATVESSLSGSSGLSGLSGAFGSNNKIDEIDQTSELDQKMFLSLRKIAPPGFLTQAFAADGWSQCHS